MLRIRPTLENKFIALASVIIFIGSIFANIWIVKIYKNQLYADAESRALLLCEATAISFTNTLLYQELNLIEEGGLLDNYIHDLIEDPKTSVVSVTVYDPEGKVLATSDYREFLKPNSANLSSVRPVAQMRLTYLEDGSKMEILYPLHISSKQFGILKMYFSLANEHARLALFKHWMLLMAMAFTIGGILIASIVARTLARPIKRLASEMRKVQEPTYEPQLECKRRDEIGELERGFVDMLTRLRAAAEEKEHQQHALIQAEKLASIGTLVSGLAHEINNPLAGIRNCLRRIITRPEDSQQTQKYARLMDDALMRIEKIVRDLLNFSRKKELVLQSTDLNKIIQAAATLVDLRLKKQNLSLKLQLSSDLPAIQGDPQHLEQIFVNLLLNAVDATPEGGTITVKTEHQNGKVIAEVRDTGKGIPAEIRDKIFDPFFTTKPVGQGTGLGLSVTKAIVEKHKGTIEVLSNGPGAAFRLTFPVDMATPSYQCTCSAAILAGGKSRRMGQNKALLKLGDKVIIERIARILQTLSSDVMIISNHPQSYKFLQLPVYPDEIRGCGPLGGIYTALIHAKNDNCVVVACDLPFITTNLLQFLCENSGQSDVVVFESSSGIEPLLAVYNKRCLPVIKEQIKNKHLKVSDFYDKVKTRVIRIDPEHAFFDEKVFTNINTPEDLEKIKEFVSDEMS